MSHWNHRVIKHVYDTPDGDQAVWYNIHEVYYNEDGTIWAHTENPTAGHGETIEELRESLERMLKCLEFPILEEGKIEFHRDILDMEEGEDTVSVTVEDSTISIIADNEEVVAVNRDEM